MTNDTDLLYCRVADEYLEKIISAQDGKVDVPVYSVSDIRIFCDNVVLMAREILMYRQKGNSKKQ